MSNFEDFLNSIFNQQEPGKCEIIDIANEEMKKIDSSEMDMEYKKVFKEESTKNFIQLVSLEEWTPKDIDVYREMLNDKDILDIRVEDKLIYFKTKSDIAPITLANIIGIDEKYIKSVPIFGKYCFYLIDSSEFSFPEKTRMNIYEPKQLVAEIMTIAENPERDASKLREIIEDALYENWEDYIDTYFVVEIEDQVIAIAFSRYIDDAKNLFSKIFSINPKLFIEVSTPFETVLLIDTCRWDLDPSFGGEQWYL